MDIFYFSARYIYEDEDKKYEEREQHGFLVAEDFNKAMSLVADYFRDDLISIKITCIGDTCGLISTENKEVAEAFKKSYLKTHYGEDEE